MPDLFVQLNPLDPMQDFHPAIVDMYDQMLESPHIDQATKNILARIRAQTDIALKGL